MKQGDTVLYNGKQYIVVYIHDNGLVEIGVPEFGGWLSVETIPLVKIEHIVHRRKKAAKKL